MATVEKGVRSSQLFIGGAYVDAGDGRTFEDREPFTGDVVAIVASGGRADAARAVDAAASAFPKWSHTPPAARQRVFLMAADIL